MKHIEIPAHTFKTHFEQSDNAVLIDVREEYEHEDENLGGRNIPMGEVLSKVDELTHFSHIYLYCKSGKRSKAIAYNLAKELDRSSIYSCQGGIQACKEDAT